MSVLGLEEREPIGELGGEVPSTSQPKDRRAMAWKWPPREPPTTPTLGGYVPLSTSVSLPVRSCRRPLRPPGW